MIERLEDRMKAKEFSILMELGVDLNSLWTTGHLQYRERLIAK